MNFSYIALDSNNNKVNGTLQSSSKEHALIELKNRSFKIIELKEHKVPYILNILNSSRLSLNQIITFCEEMKFITSSSITINRGLSCIENSSKDKKFKKLIQEISSEIQHGSNLSDAIKRQKSFPFIVGEAVTVGEKTGEYECVFNDLIMFFKKEREVKRKINAALIYPAFLIIASLLMAIVFSHYIMPTLQSMFPDQNRLPQITIFILNAMTFIERYGFKMLVVAAMVIVLTIYIVKTDKKLHYLKDKLKYKILKNIMYGDIVELKIINFLYLIIKSGISIPIALESIAKNLGNMYLQRKIQGIKEKVIKGESLSDAFKKGNMLSATTLEMLTIGEESGKLSETIGSLKDSYQDRFDNKIRKISALIEPVLIIVMSIIIGFIIIGVALPVMNMSQYVDLNK